uniref:hypothetical protein n=1 Tax=Streptomyces sp. 1222.5 TaxID=1881026 RepID=UPI003D720B69
LIRPVLVAAWRRASKQRCQFDRRENLGQYPDSRRRWSIAVIGAKAGLLVSAGRTHLFWE